MSQGFGEDEVPECLRPVEYPDNYDELCRDLKERGWKTPVSIVMNETGYGSKKATVLKAAIYNLAPRGSVLFSYDSLWISKFWSGMFISAALRGARAFPVGPTAENAPSHATPTLFFLRQNLETMLQAREFFGDQIEEAGGMLRVGVYKQAAPINDIKKRLVAFNRGRGSNDFMQDLFQFHPTVEKPLDGFGTKFEEVSLVELQIRPRPFLHLKTQMFCTKEALEVMKMPHWGRILKNHMIIREKQLRGIANEGLTPDILLIGDEGPGLIESLERHLAQESSEAVDRAIMTFTIGSHNQNPRSMTLDGEVLVAVSGYDSLVSMIDFIFILGITSWPKNGEEFNALYPEVTPSAPSKWFYRIIKYQI
jgi:hypothetical protein